MIIEYVILACYGFILGAMVSTWLTPRNAKYWING